MIQSLERRLLFTTLDPAWNDGQGFTDQPFPNNSLTNHAVASLAVLASGKVLALATHAATDTPRAASLVRYNADGSLDTTFGGGDGIVDIAEAVTSMIVLKGNAEIILIAQPDASIDHPRLEGYLPSGTLDPNFGTAGKIDITPDAILGPSADADFDALAATPDGGFYFVESATGQQTTGAPPVDTRIFKFTATGQPDNAFSADGRTTVNQELTHLNLIQQIAADPSGQLLLMDNARLVRYEANGAFDTGFGDDAFGGDQEAGSIFTESSNSRFAVQNNGAIIIASIGSGVNAATLRHYSSDGRVDDIYPDAGVATTAAIPADTNALVIGHLIIDSLGRAIVLFNPLTSDDHLAAMVRQSPFGTIDHTIAPAGYLDLSGYGTLSAVALQADDKPLIGTDPYHILRLAEQGPPVTEIGRTIYITSTDAADHITAIRHGQTITIDLNGQSGDFDANTFDFVSIDAKGGDDVISTELIMTIVDAGEGNNRVTTSDGDDTIVAGAGDDTIDSGAGGGFDYIQAGEGNNRITALGGSATINAGDGDDIVQVKYGEVFTNGGNDSITSNYQTLTGADPLTVNSGPGDDTISTGDTVDTVLDDGGVNTISTGGNTDSVVISSTDAATSTLDTGDGFDFVHASGNYSIRTGADNDQVAAFNVVSVDLGPGDDRCHNASDASHPALVFCSDGNDTVYTSDGNDSIYGGAGSDRVYAGAGSDLISGGGGNDKLFGQLGRDRLYGGNGNDRLVGGGGDDRLTGGAGADILTGGSGIDRRGDDDSLDLLSSIEQGSI